MEINGGENDYNRVSFQVSTMMEISYTNITLKEKVFWPSKVICANHLFVVIDQKSNSLNS
jgi:hypothetical protein